MKARVLAAGLIASALLAGCAPASAKTDDTLRVVASTPIVADLVREVAGERAVVTSLVPAGSDPHAFEPPLSAVREVAWADLAFANGLLLESGAIRHTLEANLPRGSRLVDLGEEAPAYGGRHIRLVEDFSLSTVWLGFRSQGLPGAWRIRAEQVSGPGRLAAFTTGTFGEARVFMASADGLSAADSVALPPDAHTHMSWAMSEPGVYTLDLVQEPLDEDGQEAFATADSKGLKATIRFAVGVEPDPQLVQLKSGHVDITASPGGIVLKADEGGRAVSYDPAEVVVVVPNRTLSTVPQGNWKFLGKPGEDVWVLAQAVLGEHIHGEIDPHLWHDVMNAVAYVDVIAEKLAKADPANAAVFRARAADFAQELVELDEWARSVLATIPKENRKLVTAHDAFGYLASAYGLEVAGFVAPNPSLEPSSRDMTILTRELRDLRVPAVFENPASTAHQAELRNAARSAGVQVCPIYADTLTAEVPTYVDLVKANVASLKACLDPTSLSALPMGAKTLLRGM
ncbi:MAG: anchored repeat ABC transporter, substrate-binding protein [Actinomycetaceae bacterium]|nr:anchored repeat ABC transporter, substrate-binding protein [Actinomycetaceae bacterium]